MQHPNRIPYEKGCPREVISYAADFQNDGLWEIKKSKFNANFAPLVPLAVNRIVKFSFMLFLYQ